MTLSALYCNNVVSGPADPGDTCEQFGLTCYDDGSICECKLKYKGLDQY